MKITDNLFRKSFLIKYRLLSVICLLLFSTLCTYTRSGKPAIPGESYPSLDSLIKVVKLNDKVIQIKMGYDAVTAISAQNGIVVIDAGISTGLTAKYRRIIEDEFRRNDIAYLINTHGHPDHTGGNSVFSDAVIIAHGNSLNEISDQRKDPEKIKVNLQKIINEYDKELQSLVEGTDRWNEIFSQKSRYQYAYNDISKNVPVTKPDSIFSESLDIHMGDMTLNLIYFGKAHSESDILIHIPERKILMVGDLLSQYGRPGFRLANKQYSERWAEAIEWIESRLADIEIIIDGHGQIIAKEDLKSFNKLITESAAN